MASPEHDRSSPQAHRPAGWPAGWMEAAVARHPLLGRWLPELLRLASVDHPVLISGEPGSGRELAARAIHNLSGRAAHPLVVIPCASLSEPVLEAELRGADREPGATLPGRMGAFEQAGTGTVLLAEVADLPRHGQELLLGVIEHHELVRLNARTPVAAPARCIATTSADLQRRVAAGLFREDLLARLSVEQLTLPPLRQQVDALVALARHVVAECCVHLGATAGFTPEAENILRRYPWPGNLPELRHVIEQAAVAAGRERIGPGHFPERLRAPGSTLRSLREVEVHHIERVLHEAHGNQRRASRILGISRWSLSRRLRKYGIGPGE